MTENFKKVEYKKLNKVVIMEIIAHFLQCNYLKTTRVCFVIED